jgi:L-alanine-DL-glutamate epimerase-like enolase superfamily enzyme
MRIARENPIEVAPLNLVPQVALNVAYGRYPVFEYALLKLHTDDGTVGLGEAAPDPEVTGETQQGVIAALEAFAPLVAGRDPFDIAAIMAEAEALAPQFPAARAALDMALYDLMGKALGVPVYKLLGGRARDGMQLYPVIPLDTPQTMAERAAGFVEMGYRVLKLKVGTDPVEDEARVAAVWEGIGRRPRPTEEGGVGRRPCPTEEGEGVGQRETRPRPTKLSPIRLRLDVNQGWDDAATALGALARLARFDIEWVEQPVAAGDLDALAEVTAAAEVPIMVDEGCHSPADALEIVKRSVADIINIKLMKCGGLYRAMQILAIAEAAGVPCILGSMAESSIASAAGLHLCLARTALMACELIGPVFIEKDIATGYNVDPHSGWATVSERPGLGVRLVAS